MYRFLTLILITITIASCGSKDSNDEIKLSSLIQPSFLFTYDLIECELNEKSSLLDLESFFSKNINKYKLIISNSVELSSDPVALIKPEIEAGSVVVGVDID